MSEKRWFLFNRICSKIDYSFNPTETKKEMQKQLDDIVPKHDHEIYYIVKCKVEILG